MTTAESFGRVVVPFAVDQSNINLSYGKVAILTTLISIITSGPLVEVNDRIIKLKIVEFDLDWAPFKQLNYSMDVSSSSEEGEDDDEVDDVDGYLSDTIPFENNKEELEEGEIGPTDAEVVKHSYIENMQLDIGGNVRSPEVISSLAEVTMDEEEGIGGNATLGEHQRSVADINVHVQPMEQFDTINNNNDIKVLTHSEASKIFPSQSGINKNVGQGEMFNGLLNNLGKFGCFGPFSSNLDSGETQLSRTEVNFEGVQDKRRRISNIVADGHIDYSHPPTPQSSIDLNKTQIQSQILLLDSDADSPSASSEIRNTVEVSRMLGFEVDADNTVLM